MFEHIQERRNAVEQNIAKSFVDETDLEKARQKKTFAIGDTFTRHGITYRCTGVSSATGRPTWSKVGSGVNPNVGKYVELDSRSSWDEILGYCKKVSEELWEKDGKYVNGADKEKFIKEKMNSICAGFSASVPKKTVIANINTMYQHLDKLSKENGKQEAAETGKQYKKFADDVQKEPEEQPKQKSSKQKLSDLEVGDEVTIVTDNKGKITKKNAKITKVNSASFEVDGERFLKRTGYHVGMDNVKIEI